MVFFISNPSAIPIWTYNDKFYYDIKWLKECELTSTEFSASRLSKIELKVNTSHNEEIILIFHNKACLFAIFPHNLNSIFKLLSRAFTPTPPCHSFLHNFFLPPLIPFIAVYTFYSVLWAGIIIAYIFVSEKCQAVDFKLAVKSFYKYLN